MGIVNVGSTLGGLAGGAATARLLIVISGQSAGLTNALANSERSLASFNKNANALGNALVRGVTLPALAVGGAALKMAADFESAMARVRGLTTIPVEKLGVARDRILDLATKFPTPPTELADSLYFAASAGLEFEQAMQIVEASAGAAAIGMGEANDISKVLIFSLNAYKDTGLTAARAMDVFAEAVKRGTANPDELALALGRVLPVAKEAGVTFDQTVASIAALTNIGLPTRVASTSLRALFGGLLAPTIQAREQLDELGLSVADVRGALEQGPLVAFRLLQDATEGDEEALRRIIPQIRAFTAYLGLSGEKAEDSAVAYKAVRDSTGSYQKALEAIRKTTAYKFGQSLNDLRVAGIKLGTALFPVFSKLAQSVSNFGNVITGMPGWMTAGVAAMIPLLAALGLGVKLWGLMNTASGAVAASSMRLFGTFKSGVAAVGALGLGVGVASMAMTSMSQNGATLGNTIMLLAGSFTAAFVALQALRSAVLSGAFVRFGPMIAGALYKIASAAPMVAVGIAAATTTVALFLNQGAKARKEANDFARSLLDLGSGAVVTKELLDDLANTGIGQRFREIAREAGALGLNLAQGIQATRIEVNRLSTELIRAGMADLSLSAPDVSNINRVLESVAGKPIDLAKAFNEADISVNGTTKSFNAFAQLLGSDVSGELTDLGVLGGKLGNTWGDLTSQTQYQIDSFTEQEAAVRQLAVQYGVTEAEVSNAASQMGIDLLGLNKTSRSSFAEAAGWTDKFGHHVKMTAAEVEEATKQIQERFQDMSGTFMPNIFAKAKDFIEPVKRSSGELIDSLEANSQSLVQFAANTQKLMRRGLDPGIIQFLVDQGPGMVGKFVDASESELKRLERAYYVSLGAIDEAILAEGDHEEIKGRLNVQKFAKGMRDRGHVPVQEASRIVGMMVHAMGAGHLDDAGVDAIHKLATGLYQSKEISNKAATDVISGVLEQIATGKFKDAGLNDMQQYIAGLLRKRGESIYVSQEIAASVIDSLRGVGKSAKNAGGQVAQQFAWGIDAWAHRAKAAAENMARAVKLGLVHELHNSPMLFTYYTGKELVRQLNQGMSEVPVKNIKRPTIGGRFTDERSRLGLRSGVVMHRRPKGDGGKSGKDAMAISGRLVLAGGDAYIEGVAVEVVEGNASRQSGHSRLRGRRAVD